MLFQSPRFWWQQPDLLAYSLAPFGYIYGTMAAHNMRKSPCRKIDAPVICVGNFTLGGAGKTPVAIEIAKAALNNNLKPGFISRGYQGRSKDISLVDLKRDSACDVGDEPLLLARYGQVAVGVDRYKAAVKLRQLDVDFIIMDDGFQSRRLYPDIAVLVVDAMRGLGNGMLFPAGPLRAPLTVQFNFTDRILVLGSDAANAKFLSQFKSQIAKFCQTPIDILTGSLMPFAEKTISDRKFLAFAGIGNPQKFYASIVEMGGVAIVQQDFPDHHFFTAAELSSLETRADAQGLGLATTAKDFIRLQRDRNLPEALRAHLAKKLAVIDVTVSGKPANFAEILVKESLEKFRLR